MKNQKMEFSKKIFIMVIVLFIIVMIYSMIAMIYVQDLSPLSYLIPSIGGLAATSVGFYYHKAKWENLIKIQKENKFTDEEMEGIKEKINDLIMEE